MTRLRRKALVALFLFTLFIFGAMMGLRTLKPSDGFSDLAPGMDFTGERSERRRLDVRDAAAAAVAAPGQFHVDNSDTKVVFTRSDRDYSIFYDVHIFYYLWYGSPRVDNKYIHWDHVLVPHWDPKIAASHAQGRHTPPEDIASSFYPELGAYSSRDQKVLESHMAQIEASAAGKRSSSCSSADTFWFFPAARSRFPSRVPWNPPPSCCSYPTLQTKVEQSHPDVNHPGDRTAIPASAFASV